MLEVIKHTLSEYGEDPYQHEDMIYVLNLDFICVKI